MDLGRNFLGYGMLLLLVGFIAVVALIFSRPAVSQIVCPGGGPKWMLDAQNYQGGCSEVLPSDQAPPNADWTYYCGGASPYPAPSLPEICEGI